MAGAALLLIERRRGGCEGNIGTQGCTISYDLNGNRTGETFYGIKVNATNNAVTQGTVTETYGYDALSRPSTVTRDGTLIDTRLYDQANRVVQSGGAQSAAYYNALYGSGVMGTGSEQRVNRYDANGRTAYVSVKTTTGSARYNLSYNSYDAAGKLLSYQLINYSGSACSNIDSDDSLEPDVKQSDQTTRTAASRPLRWHPPPARRPGLR